MNDQPPGKFTFTAEQRARHQAVRETFRDWHPGPEEVIASGAARSWASTCCTGPRGNCWPS